MTRISCDDATSTTSSSFSTPTPATSQSKHLKVNTADAIAKFTAVAREASFNLSTLTSRTHNEAVDILTNEITSHIAVPPPPVDEIKSLMACHPDLSESEACRALSVSHAVAELRSKRGCTAAEAIEELTGLMTDVCRVR